jgi:hypothetical protein
MDRAAFQSFQNVVWTVPGNNLQNALESFVGAVAHHRVSRVLASAKVDGFRFGGFELGGREFASFMAAVA